MGAAAVLTVRLGASISNGAHLLVSNKLKMSVDQYSGFSNSAGPPYLLYTLA